MLISKLDSTISLRKIKDLTYKLKLLSHIKIHNVIFIKHLE